MTIRKPARLIYDRLMKTNVFKVFYIWDSTITLAENSNSSLDYLLDKLSCISCSQWLILFVLNVISFSFIIMAYSCTK